MNFRYGMPASLALLALLTSIGASAATERPQLKNFDSYTEFLRAVVDYTRHGDSTSGAERECRDDEVDSEGQPINKDNPCTPREPVATTGPAGTLHGDENEAVDSEQAYSTDSTESPESGSTHDQDGDSNDSLEQAVALTRDGLNPVYVDTEGRRTTFRSFPMQPIDSNDLADVSLIDALTGLIVNTDNSRLRLNIDPSQLTSQLVTEDDRIFAEDYSLNINTLNIQELLLGEIMGFSTGNIIWSTGGSYYSVVTANPYFLEGGGIGLEFSADARLRMAIVDSDGRSDTGIPRAGAIVIDPLRITTSTIVANLFAVDSSNGSTGILATLDVTDGIDIDLSNMKVGVAGATRNSAGGWNIATPSNFLYFGDDSRLSIAMNSPIEALIQNPESTATAPLITINGAISSLTLSDMSLMDSNSGGGIHIGRISLSNISMINTSIYFNDNSIRVDMGDSLQNLRMALENVVLGGPLEDRASRPAAVGDIEIIVKSMNNMQITMRPH